MWATIKVLEMTICDTRGDDDLKRLFCTLYGCVHALIHSPIHSKHQSEITTNCSGGDHLCLSMKPPIGKGYTHRYAGPRVILCVDKEVISKYYDTSFHGSLNIEANELYIPNASIQHLNSRVTVLRYDYLPGDHTPRSTDQVKAIILNLHRLHCDGFVHSDIRSENLIFCKGSMNAHIIDFDFVGQEGNAYPVGYVSDGIQERHPDAHCYQQRKKIHDRYSLHFVLTKKSQLIQLDETVVSKLLDESQNLDEIASSII